MSVFHQLFRLDENRTTLGREVRAGVTSFMAMAYIIFTNAAILSVAGAPFSGVVVATCLTAGVITIAMGLATNYPMCLAAGMGLNAIVAFTITLTMGYTWQIGMGVVVIEGLAVLALSATAMRQSIMDAIPTSLKHAIAVSIGLFLTFIGMQAGHLIVSHPATLVTFADLSHPVAALTLLGLFVTGWLMIRRVSGAILLGIVITAGLAMLPIWRLGAGVGAPGDVAAGLATSARRAALAPWPKVVFDLPRDFSTFFQCDLKGALALPLLPVIFAFFMTDFFDTMGTSIAVLEKADRLDARGRIPRIRSLLIVDSLGAALGGVAGCSSNTCYIESGAGVAEGGRTGLTAVVCGLLFLGALFVTPLIGIVGGGVEIAPGVVKQPVTAAALILVGFLMIDSITAIRWREMDEAIPAFLTIVVTPLTFSITHGVGAGFVGYVAWKVTTGKAREVKPFLWIVAALFALVFLLPAIERRIPAFG